MMLLCGVVELELRANAQSKLTGMTRDKIKRYQLFCCNVTTGIGESCQGRQESWLDFSMLLDA